MRVTNYFVLGKRLDVTFSNDISIDPETGAVTSVSGDDSCTDFISLDRPSCCIKIGDHIEFPEEATVFAYLYDMSKNLIASEEVSNGSRIGGPGTSFMYVVFRLVDTTYSGTIDGMLDMFRPCNPHYKDLSKKYKKESGEEFFRVTLDGKVAFFREDFDFINDSWINEQLLLNVYQTVDGVTSLYVEAQFLKTNCTLDLFARSAEVKPSSNDQYTEILQAYDNKYDLIKLKTPTTSYRFNKRAVYQVYVAGSNKVANFTGSTTWEEEVDAISDINVLQNTYHFAVGPSYEEVTINEAGANSPINGVYQASKYSPIWNCTHDYEEDGEVVTVTTSIVFVKRYSAGSASPFPPDTQNWYTVSGEYIVLVTSSYLLLYDLYEIQLWSGPNGTGTLLYSTTMTFAVKPSEGFLLGLHNDWTAEVPGLPFIAQQTGLTPSSFYLNQIAFRIEMGRIVCDTNKLLAPDGRLIWPLAYDDFASLGRNFKKCIPYAATDYENATDDTLIISTTGTLSDTPTAYGANDFGRYFQAPLISTDTESHYAVPMSKSTWVNESHWIAFHESKYEEYIERLYREVKHNDAYDLHTVIKSLLKEMGSNVTFDNTEEYSRFFYGTPGINIPGNALRVVIEPKSNILTATYDQASQKAEITFKQLMTMLKQVYKVYWFIDGNGRLRLEHIRFFEWGGSYERYGEPGLDLTVPKDMYNRKSVIYAQSSVSYDNADLVQRYEFNWGEEVLDVMGQGLVIDMKSKYAKEGTTDTISISNFNPDLDYMLFSPSAFNKDGFALMVVQNESNVVPIYEMHIQDGTQQAMRKVYVNNGAASMLHNLWQYTYDMSAYRYTSNMDDGTEGGAFGHKQFKKQTVRVQTASDPDVFGSVLTTAHEDPGRIDSMSVNISTRMTDISLNFEP